ncbi:hypothetical protein NC653_033595 [Populus alba x Populus x berolinensis]|uniref:Uncharacterized protein n=1 Tax=Populus alba x Populus x berolinensis TaxID=444605 RepID=A0AAD6LWY7_9ROSI|nr:hypothetical protein NC653_033595 [Populus alba x Populus x berolinensis]
MEQKKKEICAHNGRDNGRVLLVEGEVGGAGGAYSYNALKSFSHSLSQGVSSHSDLTGQSGDKFDVVVCGGTLGIFICHNKALSGQRPVKLIEIVKKRFISLGGVIFEGCSVSSISIYEDASVLKLAKGNILSSRLFIDAMGNFSPVVKQIRRGKKPDGVCLVVGSCARGFKDNSASDIIYSSSSVKKVGDSEAQYFWEAFPAGSGPLDRTTYMFTYVSPQPGSPKLEELLEDFWDLMPEYQGVSLDNLEILRVIYGIFPTYRDSGIQSPVSFGGFGSLTRHLGRLSAAKFKCFLAVSKSNKLGDPVLRPFLQVGIPVLLDWSSHFFMLGYYTFLSTYADPVIRPFLTAFPSKMKYEWKRYLEALEIWVWFRL